jgi:hypothetical protein
MFSPGKCTQAPLGNHDSNSWGNHDSNSWGSQVKLHKKTSIQPGFSPQMVSLNLFISGSHLIVTKNI